MYRILDLGQHGGWSSSQFSILVAIKEIINLQCL